MTHSPEPWKPYDTYESSSIMDANDNDIISGVGKYDDEGWTFKPEDRDRILACVNACAGIPTEVLESGFIKTLIEKEIAAAIRDNKS